VWKNAPARKEHTLAYRNMGDLKFEDVSAKWGLDQYGVSFGCALVDLDGRGVLDIVYNNYDGPPTIIRNNTTEGHRVLVKLAGRAPNLDAIGAEVRIETASGVQVRQVYTERGVVASEPATIHFGLGADTVISKMTIHWPNGQVQVLEDLPVDKLLTISSPPLAPGEVAHRPPATRTHPANPSALFAENAHSRGIDFTDSAPLTDEFSRQRLLPRRQGLSGPALAVADVNGDGIADIFVSGTGGEPGCSTSASPTASTRPPRAALGGRQGLGRRRGDLLRRHGAGHRDLFITAGGVRHERGDPALTNRLYLNDGHGHFTLAPAGIMPGNAESTCVAAAADFEGNGTRLASSSAAASCRAAGRRRRAATSTATSAGSSSTSPTSTRRACAISAW
jgi:hypothetical protein